MKEKERGWEKVKEIEREEWEEKESEGKGMNEGGKNGRRDENLQFPITGF